MAGNNISKNVVDNTVNSFLNVVNETANGCEQTASVNQNNNLVASEGSVIRAGTLTASQSVYLDANCFISAVSSTKIDQEIMSVAEQQAKSITTDLGLLSGSAEATNIHKSTVNLGMAVLNAIRNTCKAQTIATQNNNVLSNKGSVIDINTINWAQDSKVVSTCVIESQNVVNAKNQLSETIKQASTTETKSTISTIYIVIAIVAVVLIVVIGVIIYFISKASTKNVETLAQNAPAIAQAASSVAPLLA